jgi:hypothetical protein
MAGATWAYPDPLPVQPYYHSQSAHPDYGLLSAQPNYDPSYRQQDGERQAYTVGFVDGLAHAANLPPTELERVRRAIGHGRAHGSAPYAELRAEISNLVNGVITWGPGNDYYGNGRIEDVT